MTRQVISELIERAERIVTTIDKWGGAATLGNSLDLIDEFLKKMSIKNDVVIQLDRKSNTMLLFRSLLTVDETALYLGVHRNTVLRLIKSHGLPVYRMSSSKILILTEDIMQWCQPYPAGGQMAQMGNSQKEKGARR